MRYAKTTTVPIERSRQQIEETLKKYGADQFIYYWEQDKVVIGFRLQGTPVQLRVPLPEDPQKQRQVFRILLLMIKAKLEWIDMKMTTVTREFMADILLDSGQTVGDWLRPQLEHGAVPKALPMPGEK